MKRNLLAAALLSTVLAGAAGSAMASDAYPDGSQLAGIPAASVLSRAQVKAELAQARTQGLLVSSDAAYPHSIEQGPGKSRAAVKTELAQARAAGVLEQNDIVYPRAMAVAQPAALAQNGALTVASIEPGSISPQP
ncbi:hypothetical protein PATSB16_05470 [Pandoraea thiooxydans]|uniref:DUF4148 domain-containing protein n=1 Tax=Pandoraea thiooxydans TaxID=445709 RepID=A0A0U4DF24_9BURK|nr:DUF4148 domain-containing protein [Pandoraea thiooxydans]ALX34847.1 hypothetical protein ABW99_20825 [Pandoraea thiooxydans]APR93889.1 hypothetical protein PATSB16_05470 [Pandoraea thiooxydans]